MLIQSTKDFGIGRLKILIYGDSGSGKTTLAGTMPPGTLVISLESGLLSVSNKDVAVIDATTNDKNEVLPRDRRIDRLKEIYAYLLTEEARKRFSFLFFDSISECSDNLYEKYKLKHPERKDTLNLWDDHKNEMTRLIRSFRDLPTYSVIFTALESRTQDENGRFFTGPYLQPKSMAQDIPKFFDFVWRLSVRDEGKQEIRRLQTQPSETVRAKSRTTDAIQLLELEDASQGLGPILAKIQAKA